MSPKNKYRLAQLTLSALFFAAGSLALYMQSFLPTYASVTPIFVWFIVVFYISRKYFKCPGCGESIGYQGNYLGVKLMGGLRIDHCRACGYDLTKDE
jgi:hypothetical protein